MREKWWFFFLVLGNQFYGEKLFSFLEPSKNTENTPANIYRSPRTMMRERTTRNEKVFFFFFLVFYKNYLTRSSKCLRCDSLPDKYRSVYQRHIIFIYAFCCRVFSSVRGRITHACNALDITVREKPSVSAEISRVCRKPDFKTRAERLKSRAKRYSFVLVRPG